MRYASGQVDIWYASRWVGRLAGRWSAPATKSYIVVVQGHQESRKLLTKLATRSTLAKAIGRVLTRWKSQRPSPARHKPPPGPTCISQSLVFATVCQRQHSMMFTDLAGAVRNSVCMLPGRHFYESPQQHGLVRATWWAGSRLAMVNESTDTPPAVTKALKILTLTACTKALLEGTLKAWLRILFQNVSLH
jgi:hypothetical protein